jgi:hypothetical protein
VKVCEQALAIADTQRLGAGGTGRDDDQDHESEQCSHGGDPTSVDGCRDLECDEMPLPDAGRRKCATSDDGGLHHTRNDSCCNPAAEVPILRTLS